MKEQEIIAALVYLWTRDAGYAPNEQTERYVGDHLGKILEFDFNAMTFSDPERIEMAKRIAGPM